MKNRFLSLAALAGLLLVGCASPSVNTVSSSTGGANNYSWYSPDADTRRNIAIESTNTVKMDSGITKVQVVLVNTGGRERAFNYIFEWADKDGFAVKSATATMRTVRLMPKETISITGVSPKPSAQGYTLKLVKTN